MPFFNGFNQQMKHSFSISAFFACIFLPQTKLISWNIANFGQSKSDQTVHCQLFKGL
jgi:hypothetical protein